MVDYIAGLIFGFALGVLVGSWLLVRRNGGQVPPKANPLSPPKRNPPPPVTDAARVRRYSDAWKRAVVRSTHMPKEAEGIAGSFSIDAEGEAYRFHLDEESALSLCSGLIGSLHVYHLRTRDQSPMSSDMPSVDGSVPQEGQSV